MLFWVLAALLTLAASLAVMWPFLRRREGSASSADHDLAVYRDQLSELEQEVRRGLISKDDAAEARAEIARRILRLKETGTADGDSPGGQGKPARAIAMAAVLALPVLSWGGYALLGSPDLPSLPLEARLAKDPAEASLDELVARAESHLSANPQDTRGWEALAPIYSRLGRYGDAADAHRRTIELAGATAEREAALGEAMVGEAGGIITAEAEAAFERALALDEDHPPARFFIGLAHAQEGSADQARAIWEKMATELPAESAWRDIAGRAVAELAASREQAAQETAGPLDDDIAAAAEMTPEARQDMIEGMVAGLDAKLRDNPADPEGWRRLLRSYVALGRPEEAEQALGRALAALGAESEDARALSEFAGTLGISRNE